MKKAVSLYYETVFFVLFSRFGDGFGVQAA